MLENATRICGAKFGVLYLSEGEGWRTSTLYGVPAVFADVRRRTPIIRTRPGTGMARAAATKQPVQIADIHAEPAYTNDPERFAVLNLSGARTMLNVPMLKDNGVVGQFAIYRQEVRPFTDKQIELVKNFAAQAVIAIENTRLLNELRQRTTDLTESLEQQTATSEVLKVISSSPGELEPVFQAMLENATHLCEAKFGTLFLREGDVFRFAAEVDTPPELAEFNKRREPVIPTPGGILERVMRTRQVSHTTDAAAEPVPGKSVKLGGARSTVYVPMLKDDELVGVIMIFRQEVRPFTDKQIALLKNFAAQAVIAIENTRLLNELRQRTDLSAADSNVRRYLGVISSSPGELEPVFDAMLENAMPHLRCQVRNPFAVSTGAQCVSFQCITLHSHLRKCDESNPVIPLDNSILGPLVKTKRLSHIADLTAEEPYASSPVGESRAALRTAPSGVPMLRDDELVGVIGIYRQEVRPFTDKQIEFVQNFAAQAVIAIENTRLLNELRKSLEQQTATSEVLKVISSSPGDLEPVFQAMLENATRICEANFGVLNLHETGTFRVGATHNVPAAFAEFLHDHRYGYQPTPGGFLERVMRTKKVSHSADNAAETSRATTLGGAQSTVCVPMLKDDVLVGTFTIYRQEVRPFTDKQIDTAPELRRPGRHRHREYATTERTAAANNGPEQVTGRLANRAGPPCPDPEARLAWSTDSGHRPRDQEPAQLREQLLRRLSRTDRRIAGCTSRRATDRESARGDQ